MMWLTLAALAAPPDGVDPDDLDKWEKLSNTALNGPAGCWTYSGDIALTTSFQTGATFFRRATSTPTTRKGTFTGTLDNGTWTQFDYRLEKSPNGIEIDNGIHPSLGLLPGGVAVDLDAEPVTTDGTPRNAEAVNMLRTAMDGWRTSTGISHARWRDDLRVVELVQQVPVRDTNTEEVVQMTTVFPEGTAFPSRLSVQLPKHYVEGTWPARAHLYDAQIHLLQRAVDGHVFPAAETMSAVGSALGFTIGYEQRLDYKTATACGG